ncbi:hypothetical protein DV737_g2078, partial [Chaetothyriales sp. CBS 132003]
MHTSLTSCPACGNDLASAPSSQDPGEAERRIRELEAQVKLLNSKAAAAVDKLADYEDEVRSLRSQVAKSSQPQSTPADDDARPKTAGTVTTPTLTRLGSLSNLLGRRKPSDNTANGQQIPAVANSSAHAAPAAPTGLGIGFLLNPTQSALTLQPSPLPLGNDTPLTSVSAQASEPTANLMLQSLQTQLENERSLRLQAEASLHASQSELEELTSQLFGEANEMVAQERQERAKLEVRLKTLEERDKRKGESLERLEARIKRVERDKATHRPRLIESEHRGSVFLI